MTGTRLTGTSIIGSSRGEHQDTGARAANPATGEALDPLYAEASEEEIDRSLSLAGEAALPFGKLSGRSRAHFLRTIADEIEALGDALVDRATAETALPAAQPALMMTAYTTVVRGQDCCDDGCGEPCVWNGCGDDCGEGCCNSCGGGCPLGIGKIVASPGGLMTLAAFSAVSVVTVTSATNNSATLGSGVTPPPASP